MHATQLSSVGAVEISVLIAVALISIPLLYFVHRILNRVCVRHVTRYCEANGIKIEGWRTSPEFDDWGNKTENTQIEILTFDERQQKKVLRFIVGSVGIRSVLEQPFDPDVNDKNPRG